MTKPKGRKSKFTAPVKTRIIEALRAGTTYEIAAQYAGISRSTLYEWIKKERILLQVRIEHFTTI